MKKQCLLMNCCSVNSQNDLFLFPIKNSELLKKWLQNIPKNIFTIINSGSGICEKHFERKFVLRNNGHLTLKPNSVPTIFEDFKSLRSNIEAKHLITCRFCLKTFQDEEIQMTINNLIRQQFFAITQTELHKSGAYSQKICEKCYSSTNDFALFRADLIQNQIRYEKDLKIVDEPASTKKDWKHNNDEVIMISRLEPEENAEACYEECLDLDIDEQNMKEIMTSEQSSDVGDGRSKARYKLCSECGKTYSSHAYKRHYERVHLKLKNYHCDYCSYKAYSRNHIEIHLRSHLKIKSHFCEQCGAVFGSGSILRQHYLTHQKNRPFTCNQVECSLSFKSVYALRRHQKTHSDNKWRFPCDECGAKFTDKWHLKRHENRHKMQSHPCEICGKLFGTIDRMKAHQIYHRPPNFPCKLCSKEFYKKPNLTTHLKTHSGQKDFQCNYCSNSYFKNAHLNRHIQKIHVTKS